ncbi:hypothetical protein BDV32DRAFT_136854 [Aspergillus pseudonomiae]|uniref:Uncharacterized protein n=1 Tax=Aspergillus pseudonomiae TaxID=1506151 RepID=A0A5N6I808_9EURO|nr:uncharacterized protein BDV37DRAFT_292159 [Aspergillus pseudonomiae]KAB8262157.1 hypothetical protein BDV32DRAFT_136854 [Aspergillus pseudonomiae]KAE8397403.1 hypothetical protein BDV37DRAFT_292159 [Aspergillus pseudonomiae]
MTLSLDFNTLNDTPKPDLPYVEGYEFSALEFSPPKPQTKPAFGLTPEEAFQRENTDVLARCLAKKAFPGQPGSHTLRLKIREPIRVGDGKTSQIVLVDVVSGQGATPIVAKIYDPLYYDHSNDDVDPFLYVHIEHNRETAAYRHLQGCAEKHVPEYYGSYTMDISYSKGQFRTVGLILSEYINGESMDTLQPQNFTQPVRKAIMQQIVNVESRLYEDNLWHRDTSPRNIIISTSNLHITFIDFGHASLGRSRDPTDKDQESRFLPGTYISPMLRWYRTRGREPVSNFEEWIDWDWNSWLFETYGSDRRMINADMIQRWVPPSARQEVASKLG